MPLKPPYLIAAIFCEKLLLEQDGVASAIRIVDKLLVKELSKKDGAPAGAVYALTILLMFKSGGYKGPAKVQLVPNRPSGETSKKIEQEVAMPEQANAGANLVLTIPFAPSEEGVYWFDVLLNGTLVTRMPLEVQVLPVQVQSSPSAKTAQNTKPQRKK